MTEVARIEGEASLWVVQEERGLSSEERAALTRWLDNSTAHRIAYIRMQQVWNRADRLAALRSPQPLREPRAVREEVRPRLLALAAVLTILFGGALWYHNTARTVGQSYVTGVGQYQTVRLDDGTRIELNTDSRIQAQVTASGRAVRLEKGEAYFEVVHDAKRPFAVFAGNRKITDIGTKFSVRLDGEQVRVLVSEGQVKIETFDGKPLVPTIANAGHALIVQDSGSLVSDQTPRDMARAMSWRSGILVFDGDTLASAADEFNRYNRKKVTVLGQARNLHVGGRFRANNADVFVSLIQAGMGLDVEHSGDEIIISK